MKETPMNRAEIMAEIARRWPESADLVAALNKAMRGGRPQRATMDSAERRMAVIRVVLATLKRDGIASRSELLSAVHNFADSKVLAGALFDLEVSNEIRSETAACPSGGRPQTNYARV
jgi:hypothetical protein